TSPSIFNLRSFFLFLLLSFSLAGCAIKDYGPGAGFFNTVILDPGHGGHDRGARPIFGQNEKNLTLDTALRTKPYLQAAGFNVILTRSSDKFIPLEQRVAISNKKRNAIFVSIHYNWARRKKARGIETYYLSPRSYRLAAHLQQQLLQAYPTLNRQIKKANFYVLRNNTRPAVLLELGFLSNPLDNSAIQSPAIRQRIAEAIAKGIIREFKGITPNL
ncbi:MAG: N-acetylmuramoyl-L-alanine amidase, partial [Chthoniobacterales bacterium]|nr:N-acetylmuramoyl-L-alanine amidase [Chthoniobacterales bacterium]